MLWSKLSSNTIGVFQISWWIRACGVVLIRRFGPKPAASGSEQELCGATAPFIFQQTMSIPLHGRGRQTKSKEFKGNCARARDLRHADPGTGTLSELSRACSISKQPETMAPIGQSHITADSMLRRAAVSQQWTGQAGSAAYRQSCCRG